MEKGWGGVRYGEGIGVKLLVEKGGEHVICKLL